MSDRMAAWRGSLDELGKSIGSQRVAGAPMTQDEGTETSADTLARTTDDPPPPRIETPTLAAAEPILSETLPGTDPMDATDQEHAPTAGHEPQQAPAPDAQVSMERPTLEEAARLLQELGRLEHEAHILRLILGERNLSAREHQILADVDAEIKVLRQRWRSDTPLHS